MGCTEGLARILVFIANFAFLLVGIALLVVGVLYKINYNKFTDAIPDDYSAIHNIPIIAIIIGAIIFVIAFLGCCGALKSNTCMLTSYGTILFLIFLTQVGLGIFALVEIKDSSNLNSTLHNSVSKLFSHYYDNNEKKGVVDIIQQKLQCCGVDGSASWAPNPIPVSCYPDNSSSQRIYSQGCASALYEFLMKSVKLIAIVALTVSIIEVVGAILALCLSNCIRGRERQGAYY